MLRTARRGAEVATGVGFVVVAKDVCTDRTSLDDAPPPFWGRGKRNSPAEPFRLARQLDGLDLIELDRALRHQVVDVAIGRAWRSRRRRCSARGDRPCRW